MKKLILMVLSMLAFSSAMAGCEITDMTEKMILVECDNGTVAEFTKVWNGEISHEYATIYYADGVRYVGAVLENTLTPDGTGTLYFPNGDRVEGTFRQGRNHGVVTAYGANGSWIKSEYKYGNLVKELGSYDAEKAKKLALLENEIRQMCYAAKADLVKAQKGSGLNILVFAITGGSKSNQRSFNGNLSMINEAKSFIRTNCGKYGVYTN